MSVRTADGGLVFERGAIALPGRRAVARCLDVAVGVGFFAAAIFAFAAAAPEPKHGTAIMLLAIATGIVMWVLYEVAVIALWGRTLGKHLMGLEVVP